jgi:hypothetical protein
MFPEKAQMHRREKFEAISNLYMRGSRLAGTRVGFILSRLHVYLHSTCACIDLIIFNTYWVVYVYVCDQLIDFSRLFWNSLIHLISGSEMPRPAPL